MSSEETDQPPPHDDEKGHTFRKWRLTIPMHQLELQAVEAAVEAMAAEVEAEVEAEVDDPNADVAVDADPTEPPAPTDQPLFDEKEKSKTFRKRRLTLTKHQMTDDIAADDDFVDATDEEEGQGPPERKKRRMSEHRMSDVSHTSTVSSSAANGFLQESKIRHAGKILRVPLPPLLLALTVDS